MREMFFKPRKEKKNHDSFSPYFGGQKRKLILVDHFIESPLPTKIHTELGEVEKKLLIFLSHIVIV